jgi:chromosome segregation ATPase
MEDDSFAITTGSSASLSPAIALPSRVSETVDADVDAFAESAFGRLTEMDSVAQFSAEARPGSRNGAADPIPATPPSAPRRTATAPLPLRAPSSRPPMTVDVVEYDRLRAELVNTRDRMVELERELDGVQTQAERLRLDASEASRLSREVDELRAKLASSPKAGGISSREFLDLREALNRKDKEILTLKENLSRKDKDFVELHDRQLAFERTKADLEDRLLALERELAETRESGEFLVADRDACKKESEEARARFERLRAESEARERQLAEARSRYEGELAARDARLATIRAELDQTLANERAEHARALDEAEVRRVVELEHAKREADSVLSEVHEQVERDTREALSAQASSRDREHELKLAEIHRAHDVALDESRKEANAKAAEARAEAERERATLDALRVEHAEQVKVIENEYNARIAGAEAKAARELNDANDRLAKLDMDLSATRGELAELRQGKDTKDALNASTIADLEHRFREAETARIELETRAKAASERVAVLDAEIAGAQQDLRETKEKVLAHSARADKAQAKWDADRQSLERAKDALAVVLGQIEEVEGRPAG